MATRTDKTKQNNPNAAVFIYNYRDRTGTKSVAGSPFDVEQIILNTASLISVSTQKSKSSPAGSFEIVLAPTKNWVTAITPGSWVVILMSNQKIDDKAKYGGGRVNAKSFKMLGRIDDVRASLNKNQATGAVETNFIVTGQDWGAIFLNKFYIDPLAREPFSNAVGGAERFGYDEFIIKSLSYTEKIKKAQWESPAFLSKKPPSIDKQFKKMYEDMGLEEAKSSAKVPEKPIAFSVQLPSARDNVEFMLKIWGRADPVNSYLEEQTGVLTKPQQQYRLPDKLVEYMQFKDKKKPKGSLNGAVAQILKHKGGLLTGLDKYNDKDFSAGLVNFEKILGEHTLWQLLTDSCNSMINELIAEVRFEDDDTPNLTLYNRTRPFIISEDKAILKDDKRVGDGGKDADPDFSARHKKFVGNFISRFQNVKRAMIDPIDLVSIDYGTNWRDRVNFIEVNIDRSLFKENYSKDIKEQSQFVDIESIGRDGLLSMMATTSFVPKGADFTDGLATTTYKYLLKEWYFNTHKMLNGRMTLMGQDQYIQVGDNIMIESDALGISLNTSQAQKSSKKKTYFLAHVEAISHSTRIDPNGARNFMTNISFVRGIITDVNGNLIALPSNIGALDQDASEVAPSTEKNINVFGTSSGAKGKQDPDRQKLEGE